MKRKLAISLFTLVLLFTSLVTNTMAWFQMNRQVSVSGFELNIYSGDGIALSITGEGNYQTNLTSRDIKKAIVAKYMNYSFDENVNLIRSFRDNDGKIIKTIVTDEEIDEAFSEIELDPVTSNDGVTFSNRYGTEIVPTDGFYVSFDIYFRADNQVSTGLEQEEVNVYFYSGIEKTLDTGVVIKPFSVESLDDTVTLHNNLTCYDTILGTSVSKNIAEVTTITANARNALRFSTIAEKHGNPDNKIYELYDGYGSYATEINENNYSLGVSGVNPKSAPSTYLAKYDSNKNAAYTYLENRTGDSIETVSYNDMPKTIKNFDSVENARITSITQVGQVAKVTFNFWVEGWDADCFEGIGAISPMTVTMSFTTVRQENCSVNVQFYDGDALVGVYEKHNVGKALMPYNPPLKAGKRFVGWYTENNTVYDNVSTVNEVVTAVTAAKLAAGVPEDEINQEQLKLFARYE